MWIVPEAIWLSAAITDAACASSDASTTPSPESRKLMTIETLTTKDTPAEGAPSPTPTATGRPPKGAVITVPDPTAPTSITSKTEPAPSESEMYSYMLWRTESHEYPDFEIHFPGKNPFNDETDFKEEGSIDKPIVLQATRSGTYKYTITQCNPDETGRHRPVHHLAANVRHCPSCHPPS
jgi:hypothetical protein